jgi:hypothetical protein
MALTFIDWWKALPDEHKHHWLEAGNKISDWHREHMMTEQQKEQYQVDTEWLRNEKWTPLSTHGARLFGGNTALNISGFCTGQIYEDEGANMALTETDGNSNWFHRAWEDSTTGGAPEFFYPIHEYWNRPPRITLDLTFENQYPAQDLGEKSRKENDGMETYLTDLVLAMGLNKAELGEIREIMKQGASSWQPRFLLYLLALWVQSNGLTLEDLGYEREGD